MTVETKVGWVGPPAHPTVSPIKVWAPSWWARKRSTVEAWRFMTPATVLVAVFFLIPTLLITYISFLNIEGSNFVDNPSAWLPSNIPLAGLVAHLSAGLWMGLSYKKLVHEHTRMSLSILGWVTIVLAYYYAFAAPGLVIGAYQVICLC